MSPTYAIKSALARLAAAVIAATIVALAAPAMADAYRVVNLPHSDLELGGAKLVMNGAGDYVITWKQGSTDPDRGGGEYVQTGNVHRPFLTRPVNLWRFGNLWGPIDTVDSTNSKGFAWMQGSGDNVRAVFAGPPPTGSLTTAWVGNHQVKVASIAEDGSVKYQSVLPETSPSYTYDGYASVSGVGTPTVYWHRASVDCGVDMPLSIRTASECIPVNQAVLVTTANEAGGFGPTQFAAVRCTKARLVQDAAGAATMLMGCEGPRHRYAYRMPGQPFARPKSLPLLKAQFAAWYSIALLPGGRVMVAYEAVRARRTASDERAWATRIMVASGPVGQPLGRPRLLKRITLDPFTDPQPTPELLVGNGGKAYLKWYSKTRTRIAMVKPSLRLGRAISVPGFDRRELAPRVMRAEVALSNSGRALATWLFVSETQRTLRATTFDVPRR